jgi:hypothetical protein
MRSFTAAMKSSTALPVAYFSAAVAIRAASLSDTSVAASKHERTVLSFAIEEPLDNESNQQVGDRLIFLVYLR